MYVNYDTEQRKGRDNSDHNNNNNKKGQHYIRA